MVRVYSCCKQNQGSSGCQLAEVTTVSGDRACAIDCILLQMHVTAGDRPTRDSGYVCTLPPPPLSPSPLSVYSLDCEMCYTTAGLQLAKVSMVDMELKPVFEQLVKPSHTIVDYNTRYIISHEMGWSGHQ